jgi:predicted Rossmann-fold nucleotide-binding protein
VREPTIVIGGGLVGLATAVVDGVASNRHRPLGCGEEPSDHNSRVPASVNRTTPNIKSASTPLGLI